MASTLNEENNQKQYKGLTQGVNKLDLLRSAFFLNGGVVRDKLKNCTYFNSSTFSKLCLGRDHLSHVQDTLY